MNFEDTPQEAKFRTQCRAFLESSAPKKESSRDVWKPKSSAGYIDEAKAWQLKKYDNGWACLRWPEEFGGRGASPIETVIWSQEESKYKVPMGVFEIGQGMCGPTLMTWGTEEDKKKYLPAMAKGDEIWCQLFSEPAAGSDVAGLRTKSDFDEQSKVWTVNGQKIWTSGAHYCDHGILVTRHDPSLAKHKGLTFFYLSMHSDGVDVKPIRQISGGSNFNEVYFSDVKIPDSQRLGAVGQGWEVAITTLMNERLAVGDARGVDVDEILEMASKTEHLSGSAIDNGEVRAKLANWYVEASGLKYTKYRTLSALSRGQTPGPEASITKVVSATKLQQVGHFGLDLMGMNGVLSSDEETEGFVSGFMNAPGLRIAGGTDEILRNIIAERVLGLPQDPRADKGVAYQDIPTGTQN